jgi:tetratricopeptide (TPR) repeat protein
MTSLREAATPAYVRAMALIVPSLYRLGQYDLGDSLLASAAAIPCAEPLVKVAIHMARADRLNEAAPYAEQVSRCASVFDEVGDLRRGCTQKGNYGFALILLGAYAEAEQVLTEVQAVAERLGLVAIGAWVRQNVGRLFTKVGRLDEALRVERQVVDALRGTALEADTRVYLADLHLAMGDLVAAEQDSVLAGELSRFNPSNHSLALASRARILLANGQPAYALACARDALAMVGVGLGEAEALARLVLAEALEASGDHTGAHDAIVVARERLLRRAERINNPEWRRCFLENVSEHVRTFALAKAWSDRRS